MVRAETVNHPREWAYSGVERLRLPEAVWDYRSTGVKFVMWICWPCRFFNKRTTETVVAAFALRNFRSLSWNDLNCAAIEGQERFEPSIIGRMRSQSQFEKVESELGFKA